jgi:membrane protease YdiL (CAAX protease family)
MGDDEGQQQPYPQPQQPGPSQPQGLYPQPYTQQPYARQPYVQQPYAQPYPQPYQQPVYFLPPSPAALYKTRLRKVVMLIAVALLVFYAIDFIAAGTTAIVFLLINNASEISFLISQGISSSIPDSFLEDLVNAVPSGLVSIVGIIFGSLALFIVRGKRLVTEDLTRVTNRIRATDLLKMAALILGINAAVTLSGLLLQLLLQIWGISLDGESIIDPYMTLSGILYVVLLGPIFEEIIFRGAILRALQPYGENFAIVLSSLLFGLYHLILFQGIFAFFVGLVLAYCTLRFSIKWAMLLHMLNNGFATAMDFVPADLFFMISIFLILLAVGLLVGFTSLPAFREQLRLGKPVALDSAIRLTPVGSAAPVGAMPAQRPRPFAIAFSGPALIITLVIGTGISTMTLFTL